MRHHRHSRVRRRRAPGEYDVRARVERFAEPAVLLLLRERSVHGYELLEQLPELTGDRVDMGNLYRFLRLLEADGIVQLSRSRIVIADIRGLRAACAWA